MTILVGDASNPSIGPGVAPHGYSSTIDIAGTPFDYHNIMASSVGAWQHTGFNANISNPLVAGLQTGNIDVSDLGDVQSLGDLPMTTEGYVHYFSDQRTCRHSSFHQVLFFLPFLALSYAPHPLLNTCLSLTYTPKKQHPHC